MELTDDRNGLKITKSKRFCAIKGDNVISSIGAPLQTLGAPNTPLWIVHSANDDGRRETTNDENGHFSFRLLFPESRKSQFLFLYSF